ncbi:PAAR repeat-containing protein [Xenorhabdus vietnamensis]|uniref:PAAR repeat-containing protein n=1 Tax=Xenorhabdus vietnamensis TaxID=351656 RepID=A0A1Y2SIQ1_9GAMM|nr:PAAR domain-containing protein [Xenorhabdus vietnamensis]OTA18568.1 PAAR repeat-containing protein [Xenorhabdus vietnamensis]
MENRQRFFLFFEGGDNLRTKEKPITVDGMSTACGAKLIASQKDFLD